MAAHKSAGTSPQGRHMSGPVRDKESQDSSNSIQIEFAAYLKTLESGATEEEVAAAAARIAAAAHQAATGSADTHKEPPPIYQPTPSQEGCDPSQSSESDTSGSNDDPDSPGKQIGRGALIIVATPFALAGTIIESSAVIVGGVAMLLQGIGSIGKKPLKRAIDWGKKTPQK